MAETLSQGRFVRSQSFAAIVTCYRDHALSGHEPRFDRGTDALAALCVSEPRCITDDQHGIRDDRTRRMRIQQIGMPLEASRQIGGNLSLRHQPARERLHLLCEPMITLAAEPDVQELSFAETPAVALQIITEVQLG